MNKGMVYLVGAGPGNPGLLTLRAKELLGMADVLVFDSLIHPKVMEFVKNGCEKIFVGKRAGSHSKSQLEIHELLVQKAVKGKRVVRLKGGDPFIFGRGSEEARRLVAEKISFEVVPGVTAAAGAAAYSGTPLTERNLSSTVIFVTGHEDPTKKESSVDWAAFPKKDVTLCIYMGVTRMGNIAKQLVESGHDAETSVTVVEWATLSQQKICRGTLATIAGEMKKMQVSTPAIALVGKTGDHLENISWFENMPLQGKRIVVTRSRGQASQLSLLLEKQGAEVIGLPLIEILGKIDEETRNDVFKELGSYDWIVFSSPNGVRHFFEEFFKVFKDIRSIGFLRIAVVGKATEKEVNSFHLSADLVPEEANADSLAKALIDTDSMDSAKVLFVTGNLGRDTVIEKLNDAQAIVDRFEVYETRATDLSEHAGAKEFRSKGADAVLFTSSSGVQSFVDQARSLILEEGATRPKTVSIGPVTTETMKKLGMPMDFQAKEASLESLVEKLIEKF